MVTQFHAMCGNFDKIVEIVSLQGIEDNFDAIVIA